MKYWACTTSSVVIAPIEETESESDWSLFGVINFVTRDRSKDEQSSMFWKLFKYISGENKNRQKIEMTVPVTTKVKEVEVSVMVMIVSSLNASTRRESLKRKCASIFLKNTRAIPPSRPILKSPLRASVMMMSWSRDSEVTSCRTLCGSSALSPSGKKI